MWAYETSFYQIYTLGFCGAPFENDGQLEHRILKVKEWIPHFEKLGVGAIIFNPVFESDTHGYNTRDYSKIDVRLGTNDDFKKVCASLHKKDIRIVLDGVFNHVGRGFWAFQDVLEKRWDSPYKGWFHINFDGNDGYNDGLWYEGWEGNYDLVKLNLQNPAVVDHLLENVKKWIEDYDIDGLRLDVAYCLDPNFIKRLRSFCKEIKPDFYFVGEMIGGDYHKIMGPELCDSATNYECFKGLFSSFNSMNMFEIVHSLLRQFGPEQWTLYKGEHLLSFADNHDVTRLASVLTNPDHIKPLYTMMFGMPGIPCVYYGSEWGIKGDKSQGDPALRPCPDEPEWNDITDHVSKLMHVRNGNKALSYGNFKSLVLTNKQCIVEREFEDKRILICINADNSEYTAHADFRAGRAKDLLTDTDVDFGGGLNMAPLSSMILEPF
ncbi:MAG: cyclomaltodextrinase [Butyrivibrio sp.]|nr:cyclomaltodextrinase [Butyrivibrio sp.]